MQEGATWRVWSAWRLQGSQAAVAWCEVLRQSCRTAKWYDHVVGWSVRMSLSHLSVGLAGGVGSEHISKKSLNFENSGELWRTLENSGVLWSSQSSKIFCWCREGLLQSIWLVGFAKHNSTWQCPQSLWGGHNLWWAHQSWRVAPGSSCSAESAEVHHWWAIHPWRAAGSSRGCGKR